MRMCSPRLSVLSWTKFRKAVMFSGRVMSPSPSTPPSPGDKQAKGHCRPLNHSSPRDVTRFRSPGRGRARTVIRLEQLTRRRKEIFQFEVTRPFQRHAEPFGMPTSPPQYVLREAAGPRADVAEVQQFPLAVLCQRFLHSERASSQHVFIMSTSTHISCYFDRLTHPLGVLWVGEHLVEAMIDVGHFHRCSECRRSITQCVIVFKGSAHNRATIHDKY